MAGYAVDPEVVHLLPEGLAREAGMIPMREAALEAIRQGLTTIEEVRRVLCRRRNWKRDGGPPDQAEDDPTGPAAEACLPAGSWQEGRAGPAADAGARGAEVGQRKAHRRST